MRVLHEQRISVINLDYLTYKTSSQQNYHKACGRPRLLSCFTAFLLGLLTCCYFLLLSEEDRGEA